MWEGMAEAIGDPGRHAREEPSEEQEVHEEMTKERQEGPGPVGVVKGVEREVEPSLGSQHGLCELEKEASESCALVQTWWEIAEEKS